MKQFLALLILLAAAAVAVGLIWTKRRERQSEELILYGNIDIRQVELPFNNNERIASVLVEEGDRVQKGQVLGRVETSRLEPQVAEGEALVAAYRQILERLNNGSRPEEIAQAEAQVAAQRHVVEKLKTGSRPEEIVQAEALVQLAKTETSNARLKFERAKTLVGTLAVSQEEFDNARAALNVAEARLHVNQKSLELAVAGPRAEDIAEAQAKLDYAEKGLALVQAGPRAEEKAEAEARLKSIEANLALLRQYMIDAELRSPVDAVVQSRILEPGEMASPLKPVLSLAITDPKWVRAYVSEPDLGKVNMGMVASITVDSFPGRSFEGWIGFVSSIAEFTPKAVQTEELRTNLVYEVRVFVKDPSDELRLGSPATVHLANGQRRSPKNSSQNTNGSVGEGTQDSSKGSAQ